MELDKALALLDKENAEGRETVSLTRAEARAIYSLALNGTRSGEDGAAKDRLQRIVAKMAPVGWPR